MEFSAKEIALACKVFCGSQGNLQDFNLNEIEVASLMHLTGYKIAARKYLDTCNNYKAKCPESVHQLANSLWLNNGKLLCSSRRLWDKWVCESVTNPGASYEDMQVNLSLKHNYLENVA